MQTDFFLMVIKLLAFQSTRSSLYLARQKQLPRSHNHALRRMNGPKVYTDGKQFLLAEDGDDDKIIICDI